MSHSFTTSVPSTRHCFCNDIANPLSIISYFIFISLIVPDNLGFEMLLQYKLFYFNIILVERKNLKSLHLYKAHTCLIVLILAQFWMVWNRNQILVLKQMYHKKEVLNMSVVFNGLYGNCLQYHKMEGKAWKYMYVCTYVYINESENCYIFTHNLVCLY